MTHTFPIYTPVAFLDEGGPAGRDHPDDWLSNAGGVPHLLWQPYEGWSLTSHPLKAGDPVQFTATIRIRSATFDQNQTDIVLPDNLPDDHFHWWWLDEEPEIGAKTAANLIAIVRETIEPDMDDVAVTVAEHRFEEWTLGPDGKLHFLRVVPGENP